MPAPAVVIELVERFQSQRESYRSGGYNETQLRREFLDPLFEALGWDVHNRRGYAEAYKEVIHEDAIKIGGRTKAPDYCFRAGGSVRSFFVEAKKPSVDIREAVSPAYQLRRYAWSARLPVSILTDFEEWAVYDCRIRPAPTDKASTARIIYRTCDEYLDHWDELFDLFSPEAIRRGSLEKLVASKKIKKGTAEVDAAFLDEIESWRDELARNIALRNPGISTRDLNFAVQTTIDRLVFLRICEDRGIEPYGRLQDLANGPNIYRRLGEVFQRADERYNSGLFNFGDRSTGILPVSGSAGVPPARRSKHRQDACATTEPPDELTLGLAIDDRPLKEILKKLYYPESPYEFSVLPAEILGQVYEQFLGKVIRLTKGGQAKVEEKPEVRKAGGVYYTPAYIVEYIVKNTVGRLLGGAEGDCKLQIANCKLQIGEEDASPKTQSPTPNPQPLSPKDAARLRILDPACGSGSFLIGAYQYLLDWHRDWYVAHDAERHARGRNPVLYRGAGGQWRLTTPEKKRILLANIYGVDIDPQAVEVTKLSLLLKVLEGESEETIASQLRLFHERALPDLAGNIKCGNSLIGPDFYEGRQMNLLDDEERWRINVFDWQGEFPEVFAAGGFDAVIGNPPWGQKEIALDDATKVYLREKYESLGGILDMFRPFVEKGVRLLRPHGAFGMVLPDIVLLKDYAETRLFMLQNLALTHIRWWGMAFEDAVIDAATILGTTGTPAPDHLVEATIDDPDEPLEHQIPQSDFLANPRYVFNLHLTREKRAVLEALDGAPRLGDLFEVHEGVHSGNMRAELFVDSQLDDSCKPMYFGRDEIAPYRLQWNGRYVRLGVVPAKRGGKKYANIGQSSWHERPKVLVRRTGDHVLAAVDEAGFYASNNFFLVFPKTGCSLDLHGLCALLNSRFLTWYFRTIEPRKGRVFCELKIKHLGTFPLPCSLAQNGGCDELNSLGRQYAAELGQQRQRTSPHERVVALRALERLSAMVDQRVLSSFTFERQLLSFITKNLEGS